MGIFERNQNFAQQEEYLWWMRRDKKYDDNMISITDVWQEVIDYPDRKFNIVSSYCDEVKNCFLALIMGD